MRLLLDECIDERLRILFPFHECQTARYAGLAGLKNGELLLAAEVAGFEVIITVDQNIPDQQNLRSRKISLLVLSAASNRLQDLQRLVPAALEALDSNPAGSRSKDSMTVRCACGRSDGKDPEKFSRDYFVLSRTSGDYRFDRKN